MTRSRKRTQASSRKQRTKKRKRKRSAIPKRSISDLNYDHWWLKHPCWKDATALSRDEQKAAVFYEAFRRHPKLKDAWLKGIRGAKAMFDFGWQMFTGTVLNNLPKTWIELPEGLRKGVIVNQLPEMLPPVGYSVWPSEPVFNRPKNKLAPSELAELEKYHKRCRNLAAKIITIPSAKYDTGFHFLKSMNQLAANGFVLVAIDNKSREAFNYAIQFLRQGFKGKRSFRGADIYYRWPEKAQASYSMVEPCEVIEAEPRAIGKRIKKTQQGDVILESKVFEFQELCKELASLDEAKNDSELMERLNASELMTRLKL